MDKSLDDIISANKGKFSLRRGGGGKRGGSGGARGTRGAGGRQGGRGRGGKGFSPRGGVQKRRPANYNRGPMPDVWSHDKFDDAVVQRNSAGPARGGIGKLMISNLDYGVNDSDINELFAEFGPLKKAAVHYDKSGRSLGTAEVWYERQSDATKALKQYNNVPLDGRPMNIQMVGATGATAGAVSATRRLGGTQRGGGSGGRQMRGGGGGRGGFSGRGRGRGGGQRGGRKPPPSADDLDAELDAYRNKMETS